MLAFFRRAVNSPFGIAILGLVLVAFVILGINSRGTGLSFGGSGAATGDTVATVGSSAITTADLQTRVNQELSAARQNGASADPAAFVASGGVEAVVGQLVDGLAIEALARKLGFVAGKPLVDGQIASVPVFAGPDGRFSEANYRRFLATAQLSDADLRRDIEGDVLRNQLMVPFSGGFRVPVDMARRYAALRVEQRQGQSAFIPTAAFASGPAPTDAEVQAFYASHIGRYSLPERRQFRYALFGPETVAAQSNPTEDEIKAAYQADAAKYAARDVRRLSQVVFTGPTAQADARAFAAKAQGASFGAAAGARLIGVGEKTKAEFADFASQAVADAAWSTPVGQTAAPAQSPFGWHVVHVDGARTIPGKSLADVHAAIADTLRQAKQARVLHDLAQRIDDRLQAGATLDEVAKANGLTVLTSPALLPDGRAPEQPDYKAAPEVAELAKAAFQADPNDPPALAPLNGGKSFGVLALGTVSAAAPRPLASIHDTVVADLKTARAAERARTVADAIVAKVNGGTPLADAVRAAGVPLPSPQPVTGRRIDLEQPNTANLLPLRLLFTLTERHARRVAAPGNAGWFVVRLDSIAQPDLGLVAQLTGQTGGALTQQLSQEYVEQFANSARALFKPRTNPAAIANVKARLTGAPPAQ